MLRNSSWDEHNFFLSIICNLFWISKSIIFFVVHFSSGAMHGFNKWFVQKWILWFKKGSQEDEFSKRFQTAPHFHCFSTVSTSRRPLYDLGPISDTQLIYNVGLKNIYNTILLSSRKDTHTPQKKNTNKKIHNNNNNKQQTTTTNNNNNKNKNRF